MREVSQAIDSQAITVAWAILFTFLGGIIVTGVVGICQMIREERNRK